MMRNSIYFERVGGYSKCNVKLVIRLFCWRKRSRRRGCLCVYLFVLLADKQTRLIINRVTINWAEVVFDIDQRFDPKWRRLVCECVRVWSMGAHNDGEPIFNNHHHFINIETYRRGFETDQLRFICTYMYPHIFA